MKEQVQTSLDYISLYPDFHKYEGAGQVTTEMQEEQEYQILNQKSQTIQIDKCNDKSKAQTEMNQSQSQGYQHRLEGFQRPCGQVERSHYYTERSYGQSERSHYHSERFHVHAKRSHDHAKRSKVLSKISYGQIGRVHGQSERPHDQSGRYQRYSPVETESEFDSSYALTSNDLSSSLHILFYA
nr:PREDICTED: LOW QUALITY PROTEIN: leucine zipper protein 4 [Bos mutus]